MKKIVMLSIVATLALGVAGITWAAYPTADSPMQPVDAETLEAQATSQSSALDRLAEENAELAVDIDALFDDSVETADACCFVACREERVACVGACGVDYACREGCVVQYEACAATC